MCRTRRTKSGKVSKRKSWYTSKAARNRARRGARAAAKRRRRK